ncbi:Protein NRT1/ PTR FAMILY 8.3 [Dichanthelium oligosanthes]|uniref:Protein NRT1/ PTR FAMILY 8.3 n=1 Tax=Dichanthelium oligosanthes TaxID=888268 RepID=A0A1E5W9N9_9POAL|nr:Protein NRT1/ PTR FAMILY 8.3 [Dichanthelium oligosanthes]
MLPIWTTGIVFFAVLAQFSSTFLEQGRSMNKHVGAFAVPPASLASFDAVSVLIWVPVYDRVLIPAARRLTGNVRALSELQRFGTGLLLAVLVMVTAALVETRRLASAHGEGQSQHPVAGPAVLPGGRQRRVRVHRADGVLLQRGAAVDAEPVLGAGAADGGSWELRELARGDRGGLPFDEGRRARLDTR